MNAAKTTLKPTIKDEKKPEDLETKAPEGEPEVKVTVEDDSSPYDSLSVGDAGNLYWVKINEALEDGVAKDQVIQALTSLQLRVQELTV